MQTGQLAQMARPVHDSLDQQLNHLASPAGTSSTNGGRLLPARLRFPIREVCARKQLRKLEGTATLHHSTERLRAHDTLGLQTGLLCSIAGSYLHLFKNMFSLAWS